MIKNFIHILSVVITIVACIVSGQETLITPQTEIQLQVTNSQIGVTRYFTASSISGVIWEYTPLSQQNYLVNDPSLYDGNTETIVGNYSGYDKGFDINGDHDTAPQVRQSEYEITVSPGNASIIIDYQGCGCVSGSVDVVVTYDATTDKFTANRSTGPWDQSCLQPTDPGTLTVTRDPNNNPLLSWETSEHPYNAIRYNIYRRIDNGAWEKVKTGWDINIWIDEEVSMTRPFLATYSYKVFAVSVDLSKESNNSTNVVSVNGQGPINKRGFFSEQLSQQLLLDIYPNPFNPITNIHFSLSEEGVVTLAVYDLQGKLMERVISNFYVAGEYSIRWNGSRFPSGIYFVILEGKGFRLTEKLLLMK